MTTAPRHNSAARYCVEFNDFVPIDDTAHCPACEEMQAAIKLDPDLFDDRGNPRDMTYPHLRLGQRVRHRTGQVGVIVGQPDGDPIIRFDGDHLDRLCYRSEIEWVTTGGTFGAGATQ